MWQYLATAYQIKVNSNYDDRINPIIDNIDGRSSDVSNSLHNHQIPNLPSVNLHIIKVFLNIIFNRISISPTWIIFFKKSIKRLLITLPSVIKRYC